MCLERLFFSSSYPIFYLLLLLFLHFPSRMFTRYKLAPLLKTPKKGLPLRTFLCCLACFRKKHRQSFLRLCRRVSAAPRCHWRSDGRETEAQPTIKKILIRLTNYNDLLPFRFFIYSKSPVDSSSTKGTNTIAGTLTFRQVWIWHTFLLCHVEASTVLHCQTPFCCPTGVS